MCRFNQVLFLIAVIIFSACKKEEPQAPVVEDCSSAYTHLSEDVNQINYKTGSYWIMYDSVSKKIDSLVISSNQGVFLMEYPTPKAQCQPKADRIIHSVDIYNSDSFGNFSKLSVEENYVLMLAVEQRNVYIHGYPNYFPISTPDVYPILIYTDYNLAFSQSSIYPIITRYDSVFIFNRYYYKVMKVQYGIKAKINYYFNVSSGFLKFQSIDSNGVELFNRVLLRNKILN